MQVDVRALKDTMWDGVLDLTKDESQSATPSLGFQSVIEKLDGGRAGRLEDLSVHLCFICLLHLANELGLEIKDVPMLNQLSIGSIPSA